MSVFINLHKYVYEPVFSINTNSTLTSVIRYILFLSLTSPGRWELNLNLNGIGNNAIHLRHPENYDLDTIFGDFTLFLHATPPIVFNFAPTLPVLGVQVIGIGNVTMRFTEPVNHALNRNVGRFPLNSHAILTPPAIRGTSDSNKCIESTASYVNFPENF